MTIERGGERSRRCTSALVGIRDHYVIEVEGGEDLKAHGNIVDHEYEIERDGDTVATVSKKWFRVRDTYGVQIAEDQDVPLHPGDHGLRRRDGPWLTPIDRADRQTCALEGEAAPV